VAVAGLPQETRMATRHEWELLDIVEEHIGELEVRIRERIGRFGLGASAEVHAWGG
jgi:hypothetical protein